MAKSASKVRSKKPKALQKKGLRLNPRARRKVEFEIDRDQGLVFSSEKELFAHFLPQIEFLEKKFEAVREESQKIECQFEDTEEILDETLEAPGEIWHDAKTFTEFPLFYFLRAIGDNGPFHIAICYVNSQDEPTFVFLHLLTQKLEVLDLFRKQDLVYDRAFEEIGFAMISGDALSEGDPIAIGHFVSMLKVRAADKDIPEQHFIALGERCREDTIQEADEIWRREDSQGATFVIFIKHFADDPDFADFSYIAVTQEDPTSHVHSLMFSFPTNDENLVDRYRMGENLQTEEVSQESSH